MLGKALLMSRKRVLTTLPFLHMSLMYLVTKFKDSVVVLPGLHLKSLSSNMWCILAMVFRCVIGWCAPSTV